MLSPAPPSEKMYTFLWTWGDISTYSPLFLLSGIVPSKNALWEDTIKLRSATKHIAVLLMFFRSNLSYLI